MASRQMLGGCCICLDEQGWKENPLVYCDGDCCDIAVHKNCYGIAKVPSGPWYCQKCEDKTNGPTARCCLCPKLNGALKKTDDGRWAHVLCALYIPDVEFGNVTTMEPILVSKIPVSSYNRVCYICEEEKQADKEMGVCLTCYRSNCKIVFHVTCAQSRRQLGEEQSNEPGRVKFCGYCAQHVKRPKQAKQLSVTETASHSSHASSTDVEENQPNSVAEDKSNLSTPLTVDVTASSNSAQTNKAAKPKAARVNNRQPANKTANGAPKPKRTRKPPAKKVSKLSPQLKSPLRSPLRSPRPLSAGLISPGRSLISLSGPNISAYSLLEQQFELGKKMLESQAPLDIAQLLTCISKIQQENRQLEHELKELTSRRDHLVSINARLALPNNGNNFHTLTSPLTASAKPPEHHITSQSMTTTAKVSTLVTGGTALANPSSSTPLVNGQASMVPNARQTPDHNKQVPVGTGGPKAPASSSKSSSSAAKDSSSSAQSRKRGSESVIKMNTKQAKQSGIPSTVQQPVTPQSTRPQANHPSPQGTRPSSQSGRPSPQQRTDSTQHFQWPTPQTTQATSMGQSVSSMLPPINALGPRITSNSTLPNTGYLNNSSLNSFVGGSVASSSFTTGSASAATLTNYAPYTQFPLFAMNEMATLNPSALTNLAMQGLHGANPYYRADPSCQNPGSNQTNL